MTIVQTNLNPLSPQRRDRAFILAALAFLTTLAWAYLVYDARRMTAAVCEMCMPLAHAWSARELALVFVMWTIMMIGMMTPSVAPAVLLFAGLNRQRRAASRPFAPTIAFLAGYLLVWTLFSFAITLLQAWLHRAALLSPAMVSRSPLLGGALLIAAGLFRWLPIKTLPPPLPLAAGLVPHALARRRNRRHPHGLRSRPPLPHLLLAADGSPVRRGSHESCMDCRDHAVRAAGKTDSHALDLALERRSACAGGTWLIVKGG
jgi:hypothetical protein